MMEPLFYSKANKWPRSVSRN